MTSHIIALQTQSTMLLLPVLLCTLATITATATGQILSYSPSLLPPGQSHLGEPYHVTAEGAGCSAGEFLRKDQCQPANAAVFPPPVFRIAGLFPWSGGGWDVGHEAEPALHLAVEIINNTPELLPSTALVANFSDLPGTTCASADPEKGGVASKGTPCRTSDDQCNSASGVRVFMQQVLESEKADKPLGALIGSGCSSVCAPVAQLCDVLQLPFMSWGCSSPALSDKTRFPFFLRTEPPDTFAASAWSDFMLHDQGWMEIGILNNQEPIYLAVAKEVTKNFAEAGGLILRHEQFVDSSLTEDSARAHLSEMAVRGTRIFFVAGCYRGDANVLVRAANSLGLTTSRGYAWIWLWPPPGQDLQEDDTELSALYDGMFGYSSGDS